MRSKNDARNRDYKQLSYTATDSCTVHRTYDDAGTPKQVVLKRQTLSDTKQHLTVVSRFYLLENCSSGNTGEFA